MAMAVVVGYQGARRGGDFEGPSSSRQRAISEVWPEPFVEALAAHVAIDASRNIGRLAAAAALTNVFLHQSKGSMCNAKKHMEPNAATIASCLLVISLLTSSHCINPPRATVCSTWRAVSRSDLLWRRLTQHIWGRTHLMHATWRDEYIYRHRTMDNFRTRGYTHAILHFDPSDVDSPDGLTCRCLALSDLYLACGFADGTVRLFSLATRIHVSTFRPHYRDMLGRFSRAVSGIIITDAQLVFATLDGDIHVANINDVANPPRRAHFGNVVDDGVLVDFTGCERYWVGLYAGIAGQAYHIWDGQTEVLTFVGGDLTDQNTVMGWRMLAEFTEFVGRVRVTSQDSAVACTSSRVMVFDLRNPNEGVMSNQEYMRGVIVTSVDVNCEAYIVVDGRGLAIVRRVDTLEEVCRFSLRLRGGQRNVMGCMNLGYALMCAGGVIRVWEIEEGEYLYSFRERIGEVNAFVGDDRHVAASSETSIHLWDFGAQ
ncbi:hypothetical protein Patl1_01839 [Pistacia atlantica]|uniref:Uncharacterized protein n=1 Tax=Pistacia atlantica TaxID=434234 RepID=A0ACC1C5X3_9ROSI|nr:hypothetical protein Patl1_01839 [Pistacia atlantica]